MLLRQQFPTLLGLHSTILHATNMIADAAVPFKCCQQQSWSPRGRGLGLKVPRGQPIVSMTLATRVKSLTLGSRMPSPRPWPLEKCFQSLFWALNRFCHHADPWKAVQHESQFTVLHSLFERIFCTPATSAPVERMFSHSGLFMRPNRARMGDKMLSDLVFLNCNKHLRLGETSIVITGGVAA